VQLAVGSHSIAAAYAGDPNYQASTSNTLSVNVAKATTTTTVTSTPAGTIPLGGTVTVTAMITTSSNRVGPTGNVQFANGSANLGTAAACTPTSGAQNATNGTAFCTATITTHTLPGGINSITAVYAGDTNYTASTGGPITVTVSKLASITALAASATQVQNGGNVTFTTTVSGPTGATLVATGSVTFLDGTIQLGSSVLNAVGIASLSTATLSAGSHSITTSYGGDSDYQSSVSAAVTVTVTAQDFSLSNSGNISVTAGSSGQTTITVTPSNGFSQQVSFGCSGLPTLATCTFSPVTVTPNGASASTTLTISTVAATLAPFGSLRSPRFTPLLFVSDILCFAFILFVWQGAKNGQHRLRWISVALLLMLSLGIASCGGSSGGAKSGGTPPGISTVTIMATAGSLTHKTTLTLTVQ
jgi:hypothetical protein